MAIAPACGGAQRVTASPPAAPGETSSPAPRVSLASAAAAPARSTPANAAPDPTQSEDDAKAAQLLAGQQYVLEGTPRFSPDGQRVAFIANFETRALYVQELDWKSEPRKIGPVPPRFRRPVFSPDARFIYFTTDTEGDEAFTIKRIELGTGAIDEVTPGEKRRRDHGPFFTKEGDRFLFTAREMARSGFTLFEQKLAPGSTPEAVYNNPDAELMAVRPDGKQIAIQGSRFRDLALVDLPATAQPRTIHPRADHGANKARVMAAAYAADGTRLYFAADDGGERTHLLAIDVRSGRELARHTEARAPGGNVQGLVAGRASVAYVLDLGTNHQLRILDAHTLKPRPAANLPLGSEVPGSSHPNATSGLAISADGKRVVVQWSTPSSPHRAYLVDAATGATRPLTTTARAAAPAIDLQVVLIPSFDGLKIPTLVYVPKGAKGKLPVIMSIHGGFPFASTARFDKELSILIGEGYAVVEPNVRGSAGFGAAYERADDGVGKLNAVRDFAAVARWINAQAWADSARLVVKGASAGGYYALMCLAHYPELWRGGIALVPLYDLQVAVRGMDGALRKFLEEREFVPLSETGTIAALSPSTYVDRIRAPLFVYAGARDVRTPIEQIDMLVRDVRARGGRIEYMREEHAGHSRGNPKVEALQLARELRFIREATR
jgi:protease II